MRSFAIFLSLRGKTEYTGIIVEYNQCHSWVHFGVKMIFSLEQGKAFSGSQGLHPYVFYMDSYLKTSDLKGGLFSKHSQSLRRKKTQPFKSGVLEHILYLSISDLHSGSEM